MKDLRTRAVIHRSNSSGDLYPFLSAPHVVTPCALAALSETIWHCRLSHPGARVLSHLRSSNVISVLPNKTLMTPCHECQLGWHTRLPFNSSLSRAHRPFELIHCDLWTSPVASISGYKYYLVCLDDYTHFLWTFPLKLKSDTFSTLRDFYAYALTHF